MYISYITLVSFHTAPNAIILIFLVAYSYFGYIYYFVILYCISAPVEKQVYVCDVALFTLLSSREISVFDLILGVALLIRLEET